METPSDIKALFHRYLDNQHSADDLRDILEYFRTGADEHSLRALIQQELSQPPRPQDQQAIERITANVDKRLSEIFKQQPRIIPVYRQWYFGAAAAVLLMVAGLGYYYFHDKNAETNRASMPLAKDADPGGNKATLTLANGSVINLENASNGMLASQPGTTISKTADGQLVYKTQQGDAENKSVSFNSVVTPNGGQYKLILPDGTRVWLNAGSSLKYPVQFAAKDRKVMLSGEGYFEVSPMKDKPFIVQSRGQTVQVLGTHFNINSYANEVAVKTTLLEGSVKVSETSGYASRLLKPGQQSIISRTGISVAAADASGAIAWKDGMFRFEHTDIKTLMRQMERWYDIQVDEGSLPDRKFGGEISRDVPLSQVLKMIEVTTNLKFKLEGKRLTMVQ